MNRTRAKLESAGSRSRKEQKRENLEEKSLNLPKKIGRKRFNVRRMKLFIENRLAG